MGQMLLDGPNIVVFLGIWEKKWMDKLKTVFDHIVYELWLATAGNIRGGEEDACNRNSISSVMMEWKYETTLRCNYTT